jgi:hypothetical protein
MSSFTINNANAGSLQNIGTAFSAATAALLQLGAVTGATTLRRIWITEVEWGAADVPNATDCPIVIDISKYTVAPTATALTPILTDMGGGDAAALGTYGANSTVAGTITASSAVFTKSINQRASDKQWWRDKATCPIAQAVNPTGYVIRARSPNYASTVIAQANVEE